MSDQIPTDLDDSVTFSEQDERDLEKLTSGEIAEYHTLLEVWRSVLSNSVDDFFELISPAWAVKIIQQYPRIEYADLPVFAELYFAKIEQLKDILRLEIESDPEALSYDNAAEDAEENRHHYLNLLLNWQAAVQQWELDWTPEQVDAAVEVAAMSEVHTMYLGQQGIIGFLDNINFQFTDDDRIAQTEALAELREGR